MVKTYEEIMEQIKSRFADDTSDETLGFIEDISDTFTDLTQRATDTTDWKQKYEDNDKEWREKYKERFFSASADEQEEPSEGDPEPPMTFEDLFKKE